MSTSRTQAPRNLRPPKQIPRNRGTRAPPLRIPANSSDHPITVVKIHHKPTCSKNHSPCPSLQPSAQSILAFVFQLALFVRPGNNLPVLAISQSAFPRYGVWVLFGSRFHVLQLVLNRFSLCRIRKHQPKPNWNLDFSWFRYGYGKCVLGDSLT